LAGLALVRTASVSPFTVGLVTLAYNLPHFIYHLTKLALFGPIDKIGEMIERYPADAELVKLGGVALQTA
jgi:hypothetical protein